MTQKETSPKLRALTSCSQGDWSAGWNSGSPDLLISQVLILQLGQMNDLTSLRSHTYIHTYIHTVGREQEMLPLHHLTTVKQDNQKYTRNDNN